MKGILLLVLAALGHMCYSQNLKYKLSQDMCNCMEELDLSQLEGKSQYPFGCFENAAEKFKSEWETSIDSTGDRSQQERVLMRSLYMEVQNILMSNCDPFYQFIDTIRFVDLKYMVPKVTIDTLNSLIEKEADNANHFLDRGILAFQQGAYDLAGQDFIKALDIDSLHQHAHFFKGWTHEMTGEFEQAIIHYKKFKELSGIPTVDAVIRICERKKASAD